MLIEPVSPCHLHELWAYLSTCRCKVFFFLLWFRKAKIASRSCAASVPYWEGGTNRSDCLLAHLLRAISWMGAFFIYAKISSDKPRVLTNEAQLNRGGFKNSFASSSSILRKPASETRVSLFRNNYPHMTTDDVFAQNRLTFLGRSDRFFFIARGGQIQSKHRREKPDRYFRCRFFLFRSAHNTSPVEFLLSRLSHS